MGTLLHHLGIMTYLWWLFLTSWELWISQERLLRGVIMSFKCSRRVVWFMWRPYHLTNILEPNSNPEYCDMAFSWNSVIEFCLWFNLAMWFIAWCVQWLVNNKFKREWITKLALAWRVWGKPENCVFGDPSIIWTRYLLNTSEKHYHLSHHTFIEACHDCKVQHKNSQSSYYLLLLYTAIIARL